MNSSGCKDLLSLVRNIINNAKNVYRYVDTDGNGRWEKLVLNDVQHGDEVRRVPSTVGGFNFTSPDGVKVSQTYSSGVNGSFFSIVHNGQQL